MFAKPNPKSQVFKQYHIFIFFKNKPYPLCSPSVVPYTFTQTLQGQDGMRGQNICCMTAVRYSHEQPPGSQEGRTEHV